MLPDARCAAFPVPLPERINRFASGYRLLGIEFTFDPGTVIAMAVSDFQPRGKRQAQAKNTKPKPKDLHCCFFHENIQHRTSTKQKDYIIHWQGQECFLKMKRGGAFPEDMLKCAPFFR